MMRYLHIYISAFVSQDGTGACPEKGTGYYFPGIDYSDALVSAELPSIERYNENICKKTFNSILNDKSNRLRNLLPSAHKPSYSLRRCRRFETPRWKTNRFRDTFLMKSCIEHNII